ncbi:hypothetical protein ACFLYT_01545, partial [Nanoarchaeota archaeon]
MKAFSIKFKKLPKNLNELFERFFDFMASLDGFNAVSASPPEYDEEDQEKGKVSLKQAKDRFMEGWNVGAFIDLGQRSTKTIFLDINHWPKK